MIGIRTSSARPSTRAVSLALAVGLLAAACGTETAKTDSSAAPPVPINTSQGLTVASPAATEPEAAIPLCRRSSNPPRGGWCVQVIHRRAFT